MPMVEEGNCAAFTTNSSGLFGVPTKAGYEIITLYLLALAPPAKLATKRSIEILVSCVLCKLFISKLYCYL